jgi:LacI family transcriptional regulator
MGHAQSKPVTAPISLKQLADHLSLSPATVSLVVNIAPGIRTIAMATRVGVLATAKEFNYHPNRLARSLRTRQTLTIGVIVPELSEGYFTAMKNAVVNFDSEMVVRESTAPAGVQSGRPKKKRLGA